MKRAVTAFASTIAGLVLLLGFRTGHPSTVPSGTGTPAGSGTTPTPGPSGSTAAKTFTGPPVQNPFGIVQVRITVSGRHIVSVKAVRLPRDNPFSASISATVAPDLRREVLTAQNARIDIISGATYTSEAYAQSLQAALDQAHV